MGALRVQGHPLLAQVDTLLRPDSPANDGELIDIAGALLANLLNECHTLKRGTSLATITKDSPRTGI